MKGFYITILAILVFSTQFFIICGQQKIVIDGDVSDWDTLGINPVYVDNIGDTEAWSKNASIVGIGATAEPVDKVAANDRCRDLKALYVATDEQWIYIRLDVAELYSGWSTLSEKATDSVVLKYPNVSTYHIYFDVMPGGQKDAAVAADIDFQKYGYEWEFHLQFDAAWDGATYYKPFLQFSDWSSITVEDFAVDLSRSAFEIRLSRKLLEDRFGKLEDANILVGSSKPGEPKGNWGNWAHAFDPQHPGCPGEASWGRCGPENDSGSDFADIMPNGALEPPSGGWWEDWLSHLISPLVVRLAPPEEGQPGFSLIWVAAGFAAVILIVITVYMLKRRLKRGKS